MSVERAKSFSKPMTGAERRLWHRLRTHRFDGLLFKRQVPIGHYIVDFANRRSKLVVEVDGGRYADRRTQEIRTLYLNGLGFRVLRFWHTDVLRSTDDAIHLISQAVEAARQSIPPGKRK